MIIYDRLYGELNFPSIIKNLLDCPGLLRLREIGMSNIPSSFSPAFSSISRYEHSIGVCFLAEQFSNSNNLDRKEKIELMIAALYHDVGTPPFAHLFEDILKNKYLFQHEEYLQKVLSGKSDDLGRQYVQIYEKRSLKLNKICHSQEAEKLGIDINNIINLILGKNENAFGQVLSSNSIDIDNIDNVFRGISCIEPSAKWSETPLKIVGSFINNGDKYSLEYAPSDIIECWICARKKIYDTMYNSIIDCALEVMYKEAIELLFLNEHELSFSDWIFTEYQLIERMRRNQHSERILKKIKLVDPYQCLFLLDLLCMSESEAEHIANNLKKVIQDYLKKSKVKIYGEKYDLNNSDKLKELSKSEMMTVLDNLFNSRRIIFNLRKNKSNRFIKGTSSNNDNYKKNYLLGFFSSMSFNIKPEDKKELLSEILHKYKQIINVRYQF